MRGSGGGARTYAGRVDLDAYVLTHQDQWRELDQLVSKRGRLSGAEGDRLLDLYQACSAHLSQIRSTVPEPTLVANLSALLSRARNRAVGTRSAGWRGLIEFFTLRFPAALYRLRRWWIATAVANVALAVALGWWFTANHALVDSSLSPQQMNDLVTNDFAGYYSEFAASSFAVQVWTNNVWVAALCIALGVFGLPVVWVLAQNVLNLALVASVMARFDRLDLFFGMILPHGLLELTAVFVAGGVGLKLFWSWVEPGERSRAQSLGAEGRAAISVALGLIVVLGVSGIIEAFVTPSPLPTWARIAIGVLAEVAFLTYVFTLGRRAAGLGETGDISREDRGEEAPVVG